jgi:hypothetical protein
MKEYYYAIGQNQFGPFTLDGLIKASVHLDTLIWHEGMSDWMPARNVPEVAAAIQAGNGNVTPTPPPLSEYGFPQQGQQPFRPNGPLDAPYYQSSGIPPKNWLVESILATLFCCLPFGIAGIVNASKVDSLWHRGDHAGAHRASQMAKQWTTVSFVLALVIYALYFFVVIIGLAAS